MNKSFILYEQLLNVSTILSNTILSKDK